MESFAQKFRVVSYSRRYAYPNQWPGDGEDNNLTNNVTDLAELITKRLNLGPAHLIGHSYGALIALYMAYQHPEVDFENINIEALGNMILGSWREKSKPYSLCANQL